MLHGTLRGTFRSNLDNCFIFIAVFAFRICPLCTVQIYIFFFVLDFLRLTVYFLCSVVFSLPVNWTCDQLANFVVVLDVVCLSLAVACLPETD